MSSPEERIQELARKRAIAPAEAARLLAAVRPVGESLGAQRGRGLNPFDRLSASQGIVAGLVGCAAMLAMSKLSIRTNGALDLHTGHAPVAISTAILDQLVAFPFAALLLWGAGRLLARHTRYVDMLATVGLSRVSVAIFGLPLALLGRATPEKAELSPLIFLTIVLALLDMGVQITILVLGFRTATGLRGPRLVLGVVGGLVAAELAGLVLLHALQR
jgi:hypothetical protein